MAKKYITGYAMANLKLSSHLVCEQHCLCSTLPTVVGGFTVECDIEDTCENRLEPMCLLEHCSEYVPPQEGRVLMHKSLFGLGKEVER
jgi:hypothetical protein